MRIYFFTENYYRGGLDTFFINLINAWPDNNDEITLVCNGTHPGLENIMDKIRRPINFCKYFPVYSIKNDTKVHTLWQLLTRFISRLFQYPIIFPFYLYSLTIFFSRSKCDRLMVINGGYPASLRCRSAIIAWYLAGKEPLAVMNFHNSTYAPPWYYYFFETLIDMMVAKFSSHIVTVSKDCLNSLAVRSAFNGSKKLSYIYNGINDPELLPMNLTIENSSKQYCLLLATYETRKGHFYLLQAFKDVVKDFPNIELRIYGDGSSEEKKHVADEVARLKLESNVVLGDFLLQPNLMLAGASVLVSSSQAYESFGLTIIEAMALGIPIVATNVGGMPEVLENTGAGFVCSNKDPLAFSSAVKRILGNPALAAELGRNGRHAYERNFNATKMAHRYKKLLD